MLERITPEKASEVRYLLLCGKSHREVAKEMGISAASVSKIFTGKWRPALEAEEHPTTAEKNRMWRCHTCKAMVYNWPCLYCQLKREKKKK